MSAISQDVNDGVTCRLASGCVEFVALDGRAVTDPVALGKFVAAFLCSARSSGCTCAGSVCYAGSSGLDGRNGGGVRCLGFGGVGGRAGELPGRGESTAASGGVGAVGGVGCAREFFGTRDSSVDVGRGFGDRCGGGAGDGTTVDSSGESSRLEKDSVVVSSVCVDNFVGSGVGRVDGVVPVVGKHYEKNKAKRERAKKLRAGVSGLKEVCPSLTGSVCTVDTRTAEEIEAVRTLAARRVAENKVARKMAELKLVSLNNKDKTDAVLRLEAARMEQRINEAKAKSQASFKECDTSLKSLGSTGSAGEFALKQEVKRGRDNELRLKYSQQQLDLLAKYASPEVLRMVAELPPPVFEHDAEVFGECPEDYDDEQRMAYDIEMNSRAAGVFY